MVFSKIKNALTGNDDKYEVLYHKYSQLRLENKNLKEQHEKDKNTHKENVHSKVAENLIIVFEDVETMKNDSFKVKATDKDMQRLLIGINKVEKEMKNLMQKFSMEEVVPKERMYDPELHEVASYEDSKGMAKGIILKTVKKGFKYRGKLIKKPRVVVTK